MKKLERENRELRRANVKPMGSTITKMVMALRKAFKTNPMGVGSSIYGFLNHSLSMMSAGKSVNPRSEHSTYIFKRLRQILEDFQ